MIIQRNTGIGHSGCGMLFRRLAHNVERIARTNLQNRTTPTGNTKKVPASAPLFPASPTGLPKPELRQERIATQLSDKIVDAFSTSLELTNEDARLSLSYS
jgi:deferrochelatase/peroxidase EfeB